MKICTAALIVSALALAAGCARQPAAGAGGQERTPAEERKIIVARVNGAPINRYDLGIMTRRMTTINERASIQETPEETARKALDQLISRELAYQEALRRGMTVEEPLVDSELDKFIMSVGHEEGYNAYLKREDLTPTDIRSKIERTILLQRIATAEVVEKVTITDDDVRKEYERRKQEFTTPEKMVVSEIFFSGPDGEATARRAEELRSSVSAGKDRSMEALVSDGTFTVRTRQVDKEKEPEIYEAGRKLREGELSKVITTAQGVHVLRLDSYTPEKQVPFDDVKKRLKDGLTVAGQLQRYQAWEQELRRDAKIEILEPGLGK